MGVGVAVRVGDGDAVGAARMDIGVAVKVGDGVTVGVLAGVDVGAAVGDGGTDMGVSVCGIGDGVADGGDVAGVIGSMEPGVGLAMSDIAAWAISVSVVDSAPPHAANMASATAMKPAARKCRLKMLVRSRTGSTGRFAIYCWGAEKVRASRGLFTKMSSTSSWLKPRSLIRPAMRPTR